MSAMILGTASLALAGGLGPTLADEPRTLCGKTVEEWIGVLRDRSGRDRPRAISALGHFGPDARAAVPELVDLLQEDRDPRSSSRRLVIDALAHIGPAAAPAVGQLAEEFRKEKCLHGKTGTFGYIPFKGPQHALVRVGSASVPALVKVLEDSDSDRRCCAAEAIGKIGPPARAAVPALIRALRWQQPAPDIRDSRAGALQREAVIALGKIGPAAAAARSALNTLLDESDRSPFVENLVVIIALGQIGAPPVARLVDAFPREGVGYELACLKTGARDAIPTLRRALSSDLSCIRIDAALALSAIDPSATDAIPVLIEALDRDWDEADLAAGALAGFGPTARAAIPSLLAQITSDASDPRSIRALVQIDPDGRRCVAGLIGALKQKEPDVVYNAAEGLGLLGRRARAAVPALAAVIDSHLGETAGCSPRSSAINALVRIDPESPLVVPALIGALPCRKIAGLPDGEKVDDWWTSETAAKQLGNLGPRARAAVPALLDVLRNRQRNDVPYPMIDAVALALGSIGPDAREAVPILRTMVEEVTRYPPLSLAALVRLAPDGRELAERWLQKPSAGFARSVDLHVELERRGVLLGMMGRTSLEADAIIRDELERLDWILEGADREGYDHFPDWMIQRLGRFGVGSRRAIPRLYQLRRHRDPWIRLWASETLTDMMRLEAEP